MKKHIAILMSIYKPNNFFEEQLESISNQSLISEITLFIRNDGESNEFIKNTILKWSKKIDIVYEEGKNLGAAGSFWSMVLNDNIQADYYAFCDQDDIWFPNKIEEQIKSLKDKDVSICNCTIIDKNGKILKQRMYSNSFKFNIINTFICGSVQGCAMTFTNDFRKKLLTKNIRYIPMHDFIFQLYALANDSLVWIKEPLFYYRTHENNVVYKQNKNIKYYLSKYKIMSKSDKSIAIVAQDLLSNEKDIIGNNAYFLKLLSSYQENIQKKFKIIKIVLKEKNEYKFSRSFIIKIILGLI